MTPDPIQGVGPKKQRQKFKDPRSTTGKGRAIKTPSKARPCERGKKKEGLAKTNQNPFGCACSWQGKYWLVAPNQERKRKKHFGRRVGTNKKHTRLAICYV